MTKLQWVILIALGVLAALAFVVSAVLRHYIGGFLENVAREEREQEERDALEAERRRAREGEARAEAGGGGREREIQ